MKILLVFVAALVCVHAKSVKPGKARNDAQYGRPGQPGGYGQQPRYGQQPGAYGARPYGQQQQRQPYGQAASPYGQQQQRQPYGQAASPYGRPQAGRPQPYGRPQQRPAAQQQQRQPLRRPLNQAAPASPYGAASQFGQATQQYGAQYGAAAPQYGSLYGGPVQYNGAMPLSGSPCAPSCAAASPCPATCQPSCCGYNQPNDLPAPQWVQVAPVPTTPKPPKTKPTKKPAAAPKVASPCCGGMTVMGPSFTSNAQFLGPQMPPAPLPVATPMQMPAAPSCTPQCMLSGCQAPFPCAASCCRRG